MEITTGEQATRRGGGDPMEQPRQESSGDPGRGQASDVFPSASASRGSVDRASPAVMGKCPVLARVVMDEDVGPAVLANTYTYK